MRRVLALIACISFSVLVAGEAAAQEATWLKDRQYREGAGLRVGDFEMHPGIGADFGYDSNYYRRDSSEDPIGSLRLRISPHFSVSTLGAQRRDDGEQPSVNFRAELGGTYNEFIPVSGSEAGQDSLREQRNIGGDLRLTLDIAPGREWSGNLYAGVGRTVRPTNEGDLNQSFNRILPAAGAELIWAPGSGMLDWRLGYQFSGTFFESSTFGGLNNFRNDITTRGRWRFLPRTALMYDARFGFITYSSGGSSAVQKTDSHPLRTRIGVNGLVTPSFGILALVGWGSSFYTSDPQDFDSLLAQAELRWYFNPTSEDDVGKVSSVMSSIAVGFIRDFEDSFIGTYLERDQGYIRFNYLFGGKFLLVLTGAAGAVVFPAQDNPDMGNAGGWTDVRVDGTLFGEWRIKDWLGANAEVGYTGYFSDTSLQFASVGGFDQLGYQNIRAFIGARVFW
ncbi:MAG: hypothetical protein DRI90_16285 [Deltaproteobacteria bacterium]|nr:MAG: hypothetical protein DRI90_16285 [Deltaproteobacteria bacterium]